MKVSACLIVKNEEKVIERCLKSLDFVDEIIVVDSGSTDKTVEIAEKYTDKVYFQKWLGYDKQRNFAASKAKNDWIFVLDADEVATKELSEEIINLKNVEKYDYYSMPRQNYFIDRWMKHGRLGREPQFKFYNKVKCYWEGIVHEKIRGSNKKGKLKNKIKHYMYNSEEELLFKINKYSTLEAEKLMLKKKPSIFRFMLFPFAKFIQKYIFQLGFLDGRMGYISAFSIGYYHRLILFKYAIMINKQKERKKT